jgi:hypothetical protein
LENLLTVVIQTRVRGNSTSESLFCTVRAHREERRYHAIPGNNATTTGTKKSHNVLMRK